MFIGAMVVVILHIFSCVWIAMANGDGQCHFTKRSWLSIKLADLNDSGENFKEGDNCDDYKHQYIISVYMVL